VHNGGGVVAAAPAAESTNVGAAPGDRRVGDRLDADANGATAENVTAGGSGSGLRFHSTMLAAVGGRLEVLPLPEGGTRGIVAVPCM
jgi:hypothetical protein